MKKLSKTMQAHEVAGFIKKSLKAAGWDVPRFETIDGCLKSLFQLGIISRRIDPNKQGKQLWFLNPKFYMLWSERRNEIQKNKIQRDKADSRLILFYNMD